MKKSEKLEFPQILIKRWNVRFDTVQWADMLREK